MNTNVYDILESIKKTLERFPVEVLGSVVNSTSRTWTFFLFYNPPKKGEEYKTDYCVDFIIEKSGDGYTVSWRVVASDEHGEHEIFTLSPKIEKAIWEKRKEILSLPTMVLEEFRAEVEEARNLLTLSGKGGGKMIERENMEQIEQLVRELDILRARVILAADQLIEETVQTIEDLPYWWGYESISPQSLFLGDGHRIDFYVEENKDESGKTKVYYEIVNCYDDKEEVVALNYDIATSVIYERNSLRNIPRRFVEYLVSKKEQAETILQMASAE